VQSGAKAPDLRKFSLASEVRFLFYFILFSAVFTALGLSCFSCCKTLWPAILFLLAQPLRQGNSFSRSIDLDPRAGDLLIQLAARAHPDFSRARVWSWCSVLWC
jgi:hypothetical protein